jgi:hypothetical protein
MDGAEPKPLSDLQLDREIESALAIEPSPEFLARVRTRIEEEPRVSLRGLAVRARVFEPLMVVSLVGAVLALVVPNMMRKDAGRSELPVPVVSKVEVDTPPSSPQNSSPLKPPAVAVAPSARVRVTQADEVPLRLSQPVFSDGERLALAAFVTALEDGRVLMPAAAPLNDAAVADAGRTIEPLVIEPLPQLTARAQGEGEAKW